MAEVQELSEQELRKRVQELIPTVDLEATGLKKFIKLLTTKVGYDVKPQKDFIRQCLVESMEQKNEDEESEEEEEEESEEEEEVTPTKKPKRGGLSAQKPISKPLAQLLGKGDTMARTEIVKSLWEYIRAHDLQNPSNKKEILLDDAMKKVFGCEMFTMFTMNKYVSAHIHPFKPVDLTTTPTKKTRAGGTPSSRKRKASGSTEKKKRKAGTQPPYRLSDALRAVVHEDVLPRPQVVSKIWDYIKARELQNPQDKRQILCDEPLRLVMGGQKKVTMFSMNQYISDHLLEKVDKSQYQAAEADSD